jgi:hypothetical protein
MQKRITTVFLMLFSVYLQAQTPISGVINTYLQVDSVDVCLNKIYAPSTAGLAVGDKILLIQMKGADINLTNTASFGNINSYNNAGNYEFGTVAALTATTISLENTLVRTYTNGAALQVVKVPVYDNVNINAELTAAEWNGTIGGILVFEANQVAFNTNIDVSGKGFLGGNAGNFPESCPTGTATTAYFSDTLSGKGGEKGEGIAILTNTYLACRGKAANGGGGGNDHNAGAGGGANGGAGGIGGENDESVFSCPGNEGFAGVSMDNTALTNKLFLGAGGGAGHGNNTNGTDGGDGGGLVIIITNLIDGNGFSIISNGESVTDWAWGDGAGGGGAGGSVIISAADVTDLNIIAKGGKGGDTGADQCTGPGGGGSGGAFKFNAGAVWAGVTADLAGGIFGTNTTAISDCFGDNNGAASGGTGVSVANFILSESVIAYNPDFADAGADVLVCSGSSVNLDGSGGISYSWSPGTYLDNPLIANPLCTPGADITYTLTVTNGSGCTDTDVITVSIAPEVIADAGEDVIKCGDDGVMLNASGGVSYSWSPTAFLDNPLIANPISTAPIDFNYMVTVTDINGCSGTDVVSVLISTSNFLTTTGAAGVCAGGAVDLLAEGGTTYSWSPSTYLDNPLIANPICTPLADITYYVTSTNDEGCEDIDTVVVTIIPSEFLSLDDETTVCEGTSVPLLATGGTTYSWSPATYLDNPLIANPVCTPLSDITYFVTSSSLDGCIDTDTIHISVLPGNFANAIPDVNVCAGDPTTLLAAGGVTYEWSPTTYLDDPFSDEPICTPLSDITYTVTVTNADGCVDEEIVNVTTIPVAPVIAGPDTAACGAGQIFLFVSEGESYEWTPATYLDNSAIQFPTSNPVSSISYIVYVTDINGCVGSDTVDIIIYDNPIVSASEDVTICRGESVILSASGATTYSWFPEPIAPCGDCASITVSPTETTTYSVQGFDANGCYDQAEVTVTVEICNAIHDELFGEIKVYPNPATQYIVIALPAVIADADFVLLNMLGQELNTTILRQQQNTLIQFESIPAQQLMLQIKTQYGIVYKSITVE